MASVSRSTSRLGEERIPLSFKVVMEPELGSSRPAGTTGEDFRANRMVSPRPRSSSAQADRAQLACPCGARDEVRTIDANAMHSLLQAPLCLCLRILPGCPRQLVYAAPENGNATPVRVARMRERAYTDALHAAAAASSAMMCIIFEDLCDKIS